MTVDKEPCVTARKVGVRGLPEWDQVAELFKGADSCRLGQFWRKGHDAGYQPAEVRVAWNDDGLLVHAVLRDADPFNDVVAFNALSYQAGDVFEIFLRPTEQPAYFEFHVTPLNQKLQLRFPQAGGSRGLPIDTFKLYDRQIGSRARLTADGQGWEVLALLPFDMVSECGAVTRGTEWLFSFSRYDYTRGVKEPVLSSTSPHTQIGFHTQADWGTLVFGPPKRA